MLMPVHRQALIRWLQNFETYNFHITTTFCKCFLFDNNRQDAKG
jgi:hypothetical protein